MRNYEEGVAFIQSDMFTDLVVAKGMNTNRIMEDSECIFVPISKNWVEKLKNAHPYGSPKSPTLKNGVEEPSTDSVYKNFMESIKNLVHLEGGEICKSDGQYPQTMKPFQNKPSVSYSQQDKVEVKVVTLKSSPQKMKDYIVSLYKGKKAGTMLGSVVDSPNRLTFSLDFSSYHGSLPRDKEGKLGVCRYSKWKKDSEYPSATFVTFIDPNLLEKTLIEKKFDITLHEYPEDIELKCQHDENLVNIFQPLDLEEELKLRKDYTDRPIISLESDYFENKEMTFSIQKSAEGEDAELTVYLLDINHYIPHNSLLDLEARKRMMSYNLPLKEYPMLPSFVYNMLHFRTGIVSPAIAVTVPLNHGGNPLSFKNVPLVEKCVIKPLHRLNYEESEKMLHQIRSDLNEEKENFSSKILLSEKSKEKDEKEILRQFLSSLVKISEDIKIAYNDRSQLTALDTFLFTDLIEQETQIRITVPVSLYKAARNFGDNQRYWNPDRPNDLTVSREEHDRLHALQVVRDARSESIGNSS